MDKDIPSLTRQLKIHSIKRTLLLLLIPSSLAILLIAWISHGSLLEKMSQTYLANRLKDEAGFLEHSIRVAKGNVGALKEIGELGEFFHHPFALSVDGNILVFPESLSDQLVKYIAIERSGLIDVTANETIQVYRKKFSINDREMIIVVAEDVSDLATSQENLHIWTAGLLVVLILLSACFILLGVNLALRPVSAIKGSLAKLRQGATTRIELDAPSEFKPLISQLNYLIDSLDKRLEKSRNAVANLSHSVKTPIAAVKQILEDGDRPIDLVMRQQLVDKLNHINYQLESEMRRSRFAGPQIGKNSNPIKQVKELIWMFGKLYPEKSFEWTANFSEEQSWPIEEHDLNEIMGNLLDNAGKWAQKQVKIILESSPGLISLCVVDDGPGVALDQIDKLGQRGIRLDEQTPGHGIGLSIVREIVQQYKGEFLFRQNEPSGLLVNVTLAIKPAP